MSLVVHVDAGDTITGACPDSSFPVLHEAVYGIARQPILHVENPFVLTFAYQCQSIRQSVPRVLSAIRACGVDAQSLVAFLGGGNVCLFLFRTFAVESRSGWVRVDDALSNRTEPQPTIAVEIECVEVQIHLRTFHDGIARIHPHFLRLGVQNPQSIRACDIHESWSCQGDGVENVVSGQQRFPCLFPRVEFQQDALAVVGTDLQERPSG